MVLPTLDDVRGIKRDGIELVLPVDVEFVAGAVDVVLLAGDPEVLMVLRGRISRLSTGGCVKGARCLAMLWARFCPGLSRRMASSVEQTPGWWNGRHKGLKIPWE